MRRTTTLLGVLVGIVAVTVVLAEPTYIGAAKCKMCHKTEYTSWEGMKHASAFDLLSAEEQADPECLTCHATGASAEMPGVQCESCHGPGSDYKSMSVMKDHEASLAAGLVIPDQAVCESCHTGAPHDQKPFDYAAAVAAGRHEVKAKE